MAQVQIAFTTSAPGNFTLPHTLGAIPGSVIFELTSGGSVWFQPARYDANNLYLVASDAGLQGYAIVYSGYAPVSALAPVGNSTIRLQDIVDDALTLGDVAPALATGGFSVLPAISIANDVMQALINGGPGGDPYNWKWNRFNIPPFVTISLQQDYFVPGLVNLGWLESAWAINLNQTSIPKQKFPIEVRKDLLAGSRQSSNCEICWLPNNMLTTGTWGQVPLGPTAGNPSGDTTSLGPGESGQQNPGPGVVYTNPVGTLLTPVNASTAITDPNGNLWALTTFGTCGTTQPTWPTSPTYPTVRNPNILPTTVTDGTCVWTAINPYGQGIRISPVPAQTGVAWQIQPVGQAKAPRFTSLSQFLNPIPDDWEWTFKRGFFAECFRRNPDPKVRAKYPQEKQWWLEALDKSVRQADREMDDFGFYPATSIMDSGYGISPITPALPFGPRTW